MAKKTGVVKQDKAPAAPVAAPPAPPRQPTGWRKWLYRLLAMTLVPAVFLGVVEMLLHLYGYGHPVGYFLPGEIDGQAVFVENPNFGRRFFPPAFNRFPLPMVMPATKAPGTYRIFILGESAALGFPDASFNFGRILQAMLKERYPQTQFEIINASLAAANSHVILPIARDCAGHEPDLYVVYMGNNEVVGPYATTELLGPFCPSVQLVRASVWVKGTRTGQLLGNLMRQATESSSKPRESERKPTILANQVKSDDPRLDTIRANYASNLQNICAAGRRAGAKVLVCNVAVNLKDSAPMASVSAANLTLDQAAEWRRIYDEGASLESARDFAAAADQYRRAAGIDNTVADLHFRLGRCLLGLKQPDKAREHFSLARDLDALRFRTDSRLNETIRKTVSDMQDEDIHLADVEQAFAKASPDGIPGEALFYEHVHLSFDGNYWIARTVLEQISKVLPESVRARGKPDAPVLSVQECKERLPFTPWNRKNGLNDIISMGILPPFTFQLDHKERLERWRLEMLDLIKGLDAGGTKEAIAAYRRVLERQGGDYYLHKDFAALLSEQGQLDEAIRQMNKALRLMPHDPTLHAKKAELLALQGNMDDALASCTESLKLMPDNPEAQNIMGKLLIATGAPDKAVAHFTQALKLSPFNYEFYTNLGKAWAVQEEYSKAADAYKEALRLEPNFLPAHHQMGQMLNNMRRFSEAEQFLQQALHIDPKYAPVYGDLVTVLMNQNKAKEAMVQMQKALELKPDWTQMRQRLQALQQQFKTAPENTK